MANPDDGRTPLNLLVEIEAAFRSEAGPQVLDAVRAYVQDQMDRLQVPASVSIDVTYLPPVSTTAQRPALTMGNGVTTFNVPPNETFGSALAMAAFDSRELAITVPAVHAVWRAWFDGEDCPAPLVDDCRALFRDAVRWGLALDRVRFAATMLRNRQDDGEVALFFEQVIAGFVPRVALRVSAEQHALMFDPTTGEARVSEGDTDSLPKMLAMMQEGLFWELGLYLPPAAVVADPDLGPTEVQIEINDLSLPRAQSLGAEVILVSTSSTSPELAGMDPAPAINPANGNDFAIVAARHAPALSAGATMTTWGTVGYVVLLLSAAIRRHAGAFMTAKLAGAYVTQLRRAFPRLADALLPGFDPATLARIFRCLADEGITLRDLRTIGDALLSVSGLSSVDSGGRIVFQPETSIVYPASAMTSEARLLPADYAEVARMSLRYYISHKFTRGQNTLQVYLMDRDLEQEIAAARGVLTEEAAREVLLAVRAEIGNAPRVGAFPVILTILETRRHVRRIIERDFPNVAVLSYQELQPDMNIQPLARITR